MIHPSQVLKEEEEMTVENSPFEIDWCLAYRAQLVVVRLHFTEERDLKVRKHETAVVQPGDRIQWTTNWRSEGGPQIRIGDFQLLADLDALADVEKDGSRELGPSHVLHVRHGDQEGVHKVSIDSDLKNLGNRPEDLQRIVNPGGTRDFKAPRLFLEEERIPGDFVDPIAHPIISSPIADTPGHWLWCYTWEFKDASGKICEDDPHIFMHERPGY